jgi:hypothetical protein
MANLSRTTQDHDEIRKWAEERGGKPAHVKSTESNDDVGILRIDFPGYSGEETLEEIPWEKWFEKFDDRNLALIYQETTADGQKSNFNKIVSAETAAESETRRKATGKKSTGATKKAGTPAKKAVAKKAAPKKAAKKAVGQKTGPNRAASKKAAPKKIAAKKTVAKKAVKKTASAKKAATKKTAAKKRR